MNSKKLLTVILASIIVTTSMVGCGKKVEQKKL